MSSDYSTRKLHNLQLRCYTTDVSESQCHPVPWKPFPAQLIDACIANPVYMVLTADDDELFPVLDECQVDDDGVRLSMKMIK